MAGFSAARTRALLNAIRDGDKEDEYEVLQAMAEMTEPYGTISSVKRIAEGEADMFDYLAAVPLVGVPARAARALRRLEDMGPGELVELGYDPATASKIAWGELPMDAESRIARAKEQGFDVDETVYRGVHNFGRPIHSNIGKTFSTPDPRVAGTYVENPQNVIDTYPEDTPLSEMTDLQTGAIYPMYRRPGMQLTVDPGMDATTGEAFNLEGPTSWSSIPEESVEYDVSQAITAKLPSKSGGPFTTDDIARAAFQKDYDSVEFVDIDDRMDDEWKEFGEGRFNIDPETGEAVQTTATIYADRPQNIRSIYAAFDPDAQDPTNIMAGVTGLGGTALIAELLRQMEEEEDENSL